MLYRFEAYAFDPARYDLRHAGQPIALRPQACELLAYLLRHRDRVVPKEELLAQVWPGQYVGDGVLHACVLAVRTALHDTGRTPSLLHTVRGRGYRFVAPVEVCDLPLDDPPQALHPVQAEHPPLADALLPSPAVSKTPATAVVAAEPQAEGEYKPVSVLCGGLAEAQALAARLGLEGLYRLLQTVVELSQEVLQPYAGTLLPPTSEGITVVFGVPVVQEDHARRAVLAARLDRLPPEAKRLLQTAAVIGKDAPFALLQVIAKRSVEDLREHLTHEVAYGFALRSALQPLGDFQHILAVWHAPTPGALPARPRQAIRQDRPGGAGPRGAVRCQCSLPRHGDDLLAAPDRGGAGAGLTDYRGWGACTFERSIY